MITRRFLAAVAALAATAPVVRTKASTAEANAHRAVYHLSDREKVGFVLANIGNHYVGVEDGMAEIALVVHGPALAAFRKGSSFIEIADPFKALVENGLAAFACVHTLEASGFGLEGLLPDFKLAPIGGVVLIAELQAQGFAYLKP